MGGVVDRGGGRPRGWLWDQYYDSEGTLRRQELPAGIAVGPGQQHVYVTGNSYLVRHGRSTGFSWATVAYRADGSEATLPSVQTGRR